MIVGVLLAGRSTAERAPVLLQTRLQVNRMQSDITRRADPSMAEVPLHRQVPGLEIAACVVLIDRLEAVRVAGSIGDRIDAVFTDRIGNERKPVVQTVRPVRGGPPGRGV